MTLGASRFKKLCTALNGFFVAHFQMLFDVTQQKDGEFRNAPGKEQIAVFAKKGKGHYAHE